MIRTSKRRVATVVATAMAAAGSHLLLAASDGVTGFGAASMVASPPS